MARSIPRRSPRRRTLTELGAGIGRYAKAIRASGLTGRVIAYDGMPDVESKSGGAVRYADLSTKENAIEQSDWAMTLEVAEHVPKRFEATFLQNIDRANRRGVVLSWSRLQASVPCLTYDVIPFDSLTCWLLPD